MSQLLPLWFAAALMLLPVCGNLSGYVEKASLFGGLVKPSKVVFGVYLDDRELYLADTGASLCADGINDAARQMRVSYSSGEVATIRLSGKVLLAFRIEQGKSKGGVNCPSYVLSSGYYWGMTRSAVLLMLLGRNIVWHSTEDGSGTGTITYDVRFYHQSHTLVFGFEDDRLTSIEGYYTQQDDSGLVRFGPVTGVELAAWGTYRTPRQ
ncbi:MAG TPA: hypothetical protein ENL12_03495 [Dehalococcoidia bacterium]|nr:hypothetical protein [Dehalococcoidia bacterium]